VGLDAREGMVAVRGWTERTGVRVADAARRALEAGISTIVYTDIERDGMLTGPHLEGCSELIGLGAQVIASGGFATLEQHQGSRGGRLRRRHPGPLALRTDHSAGEALAMTAGPGS
jgi:phosphoribosylformimino-5-aminoimidazole carboxamide ribotide isomerase